MNLPKKITEFACILLCAFLLALTYTVFVFPNNFAPAGIDGLCTMIGYVSGIKMGYLSLLVNIPLLIAAFLFLSRDFAVKTAVFVVMTALSLLFLSSLDLSGFLYRTETGSSIVLAPVAAGTVRGMLYAVTLNVNCSGGGIDLIAALVKKSRPYFNFMHIIFVINSMVALLSYFVYGLNLEPVICSILYAFITSGISNSLRLGADKTVKFEIILSHPEELCDKIVHRLGLSATVLDAHGAYSGSEKKMVVCISPKNKVPELEDLLLEYTRPVVFKSAGSDTLVGKNYT